MLCPCKWNPMKWVHVLAFISCIEHVKGMLSPSTWYFKYEYKNICM